MHLQSGGASEELEPSAAADEVVKHAGQWYRDRKRYFRDGPSRSYVRRSFVDPKDQKRYVVTVALEGAKVRST